MSGCKWLSARAVALAPPPAHVQQEWGTWSFSEQTSPCSVRARIAMALTVGFSPLPVTQEGAFMAKGVMDDCKTFAARVHAHCDGPAFEGLTPKSITLHTLCASDRRKRLACAHSMSKPPPVAPSIPQYCSQSVHASSHERCLNQDARND